MLYLDTNILVYSLVNQDSGKMLASQALINQSIADSSLILSPLSLQELTFTLAKLDVPRITIVDSFNVFKAYIKHEIDAELCDSAFQLALSSNMLLNFNDAIHMRFAERYASKIFTFDKGFRKFGGYVSIPVEVLP
jgi:predicted nucleic acid-binding protein